MNQPSLLKYFKLALFSGIISLLAIFYFNKENTNFYLDYLSVFSYFISLSIGATFLVLLMHLTRAGWGVVVRRIPEHLMSLLPIYALLFVPILFGLDTIFEWLNPDVIATDYLVQKKLPYLNLTFFIIRNIIYFTVFAIVSRYYWVRSVRQDSVKKADGLQLTKNMQRRSPIAILAMALATSFASFDWLMSLYSHWFSTIFGIYYFAGCMVFLLSVTIITYELLLKLNIIKDVPTNEHFHDLSKLLYGFVIFWSYVAFSQYFLTWYANIPEFTQWYYPRLHNGWDTVFYALIIFHFLLPLFGFMSRHVKRNSIGRVAFSIIFIVIHYVDIRFLIYPNSFKKYHEISLIEGSLIVSFALIVIPLIAFKIVNHQKIPINDPRLEESKKLENAL